MIYDRETGELLDDVLVADDSLEPHIPRGSIVIRGTSKTHGASRAWLDHLSPREASARLAVVREPVYLSDIIQREARRLVEESGGTASAAQVHGAVRLAPDYDPLLDNNDGFTAAVRLMVESELEELSERD
jgi:hypothetical protein